MTRRNVITASMAQVAELQLQMMTTEQTTLDRLAAGPQNNPVCLAARREQADRKRRRELEERYGDQPF